MRHWFRGGFVVGLMLAASSALAQPPGSLSDRDYFPLHKGAKWTYKVGDKEVVVSVAGTERIGNEDGVRVETHADGEFRTSELFVVRTDGVYRAKVKDEPIVPPVKVLAFPIKVGGSWPVDSKIGTQTVKGTMAVKSDREKVKVPAGEFETVFVETRDIDIAGAKTTVRFWYARNYGMVKEEFTFAGGETVLLELAKFEPGEVPPPPVATPEPAAAPAWAFAPPGCIVSPQCIVFPVTTQESCGCRARFVRCWVRRR